MTQSNNSPACAGTEIDSHSNDYKEVQKFKELCAECPIRMACLSTALDRKERWGTWGGASQTELRVAQSVDIDGKKKIYGKGQPTRCPYCGPYSTKYIYIVEKKRTGTHIGCSNCGLQWFTKKLVDKNLSNL